MCEKFFPPREKVKSAKFEIDDAYREEGEQGLSRASALVEIWTSFDGAEACCCQAASAADAWPQSCQHTYLHPSVSAAPYQHKRPGSSRVPALHLGRWNEPCWLDLVILTLVAGVDLVRARKLQELEAYRREQEVGGCPPSVLASQHAAPQLFLDILGVVLGWHCAVLSLLACMWSDVDGHCTIKNECFKCGCRVHVELTLCSMRVMPSQHRWPRSWRRSVRLQPRQTRQGGLQAKETRQQQVQEGSGHQAQGQQQHLSRKRWQSPRQQLPCQQGSSYCSFVARHETSCMQKLACMNCRPLKLCTFIQALSLHMHRQAGKWDITLEWSPAVACSQCNRGALNW
jgi:hypothetical protein